MDNKYEKMRYGMRKLKNGFKKKLTGNRGINEVTVLLKQMEKLIMRR